MSYNIVERMAGVEKLKKLEVLYMNHNKVSSWVEFERLVRLCSLLCVLVFCAVLGARALSFVLCDVFCSLLCACCFLLSAPCFGVAGCGSAPFSLPLSLTHTHTHSLSLSLFLRAARSPEPGRALLCGEPSAGGCGGWRSLREGPWLAKGGHSASAQPEKAGRVPHHPP